MLRSQQGGLLAIAAFLLWGAFPFYFKLVTHIGSLSVLAHRVIWATVCLLALILLLKRWKKLLAVFCDSNQWRYLFLSTLLIATNWGVYIWAVDTNRLFEASLGYYINPLLNVLLGFILLKETLRKVQWFAVGLAFIGVGLQVLALGKVPWIALLLATSFGLYGLIHKTITIDSISGLLIETLLLLPIALVFLIALGLQQTGPAVWTIHDWLLLSLAGPVTIAPLLLFTAATKRISYSSIGFFQYITPSVLFLLALFFYQEPFSMIKLLTFVLIWVALLTITVDALYFQRGLRKSAVPPVG